MEDSEGLRSPGTEVTVASATAKAVGALTAEPLLQLPFTKILKQNKNP